MTAAPASRSPRSRSKRPRASTPHHAADAGAAQRVTQRGSRWVIWLLLGGAATLVVGLAAVMLTLAPAPRPGLQVAPSVVAQPAAPNVKGRLDAPGEIEEWGDFQ